MSDEQMYDPLEIKEGIIPSFINWCKKRIRSIITVGSIGLVLTGIQTYKAVFAPDLASEINEIINSSIYEYDAINPVEIPDSLIANNTEVQLLKSFQDEFEIYKLYLRSLNTKDVREDDEIMNLSMYKYRYENTIAFGAELTKILEISQRVFVYEGDTLKNNNFGKTINAGLLPVILKLQKESNKISEKSLAYLSLCSNRGFNKLTSKERKRLSEELYQGYANESNLKSIDLQSKLLKSVYIAVSIRLREIMRDSK